MEDTKEKLELGRLESQDGGDNLRYVLIEMIRHSEVKTEWNGLTVERKNSKVLIEGVEWGSDERVRLEWKAMPVRRKLLSEAHEIDCKVLGDIIIIRPFDITCFKKGSLVIPAGALEKSKELATVFKEMPLQGIVVKVGPGWMLPSGILNVPDIKVGDHVCVKNTYSVSDFIYRGVLYYQTTPTGIISIMPESYTDSILNLKFDETNKK